MEAIHEFNTDDDDDEAEVLEEEKYNDDLDIGGGVGISTLDHSLEPGSTPPNVSTSVRSFLQNWAEKCLARISWDVGMLCHVIIVASTFCMSCPELH